METNTPPAPISELPNLEQDKLLQQIQPKQNTNKKPKNTLVVVLSLVIILLIGVAGSFAYMYFQSNQRSSILDSDKEMTPETKVVEEVETKVAEQEKTEIVEQKNSDDTLKSYSNKDSALSKYSFSYPTTWEIIDKIPAKYMADMDVDLKELGGEEWLKNKMLTEVCSGPILQNKLDDNQIIVFDVKKIDPEGHGGVNCWALGYFMKDDKWKIADIYIYPVGSDDKHTAEWRGDYLKMQPIGTSSNAKITAALVNYETFKLLGDDALQTIKDSFKFD